MSASPLGAKPRTARRGWGGGLALASVLVSIALLVPASAGASSSAQQQQLARVNGTGSTYVGLAMKQWTAEGQSLGLEVNYTQTGSPDGLSRFNGGQVDFAATEAEFASLSQIFDVARGFQYVPDVAGAIAVMYNVDDLSNRPVDYLHLSRATVAKIFLGEITHWDDAQIAAENRPANLRLPHEPINVVYRSGESGTTALFYDFVREMEPDLYSAWLARNRLPNGRIIALDSAPGFAPKTQALSGSDQIAQYLGSDAGKWSIAYDEFGYAKVYGANSAWIENESGSWVLPYAENISAALDSATLRPDLSQELRGVYRSANPLTYPISAYSYLVAQCQDPGDRPTCRGPYANAGVAGTLTKWMRYIACEGQVSMAQLGYSPLPPVLSQEMANSIGRMNGVPAETLDANNCANPRFRGSLGAGATSPPDPYLGLPGFDPGPGGPGDPSAAESGPGGAAPAGGPGGSGTNGPASGASGATGTNAASSTSGDAAASAGAGRLGSGASSIAGGSTDWRAVAPVAYARALIEPTSWPLLIFLAVLAVPVLAATAIRRGDRRRGAGGGPGHGGTGRVRPGPSPREEHTRADPERPNR
jgi:phosphate transport system substrate-binding protein